MDRPPDVVRYVPSRGKFLVVALGCAAVGLSCLLRLVVVGAGPWAAIGAGLSLLGVINGLQSLDRSRCHIELGPEGFVERSPLRCRRIRWSEVAEFALLPLPRRTCWVVYRPIVPDSPRIPGWLRASRRRQVVLADTYGLDAAELVDLLNSWRMRFGSPTP
ncbi:hypothetical protein [Tautonia sociabilis]|uniref:PH domain-containing protein n=1 Tax=Tautonia sociabilis TaxID=2080755 RepID=A0A432MS27_9BACT|nr:hypothetical protein [Tautonia sociabilis]RUL89765.1 hypothetical protein TsocGM_00955 [Tautonia sociabilis]